VWALTSGGFRIVSDAVVYIAIAEKKLIGNSIYAETESGVRYSIGIRNVADI